MEDIVSPYTKVLDYHDILLRKGDIDTLSGTGWINDQVVDFYFEYCLRERLRSPENIAFVGGGTTFFIANGEHYDYSVTLAPLKLDAKDLIFFALNNNPCVDQYNGGSHWSLLVFQKHQNKFSHFDSSKGVNDYVVQVIVPKISKLIKLMGDVAFVEEDTSQQKNSHDCGIYMLMIAEKLAVQYVRGREEGLSDLKELMEEVTEDNATQMRLGIVELINNLRIKSSDGGF